MALKRKSNVVSMFNQKDVEELAKEYNDLSIKIKELEKRVNSDMKIAFSMYPTEVHDIMDVADIGEVMPPKSTWFEPKLRSGLFIHKLS